jgi:SAM-dependent methyltransferase
MSSFSAEQHSYPASEVARAFGSDPGRYDRARPSYPGELVSRIIATSPGHDVLDVGCGSGIVARQFQAAGCRVLGIDVDARMAEFARLTGLPVEVATFEAWNRDGREFDVVVSGQAWHWVDPLLGAAKAADALRPDGRLAVFWNVAQPPPEVARALSEVYRQVLPDSPFSSGVLPGLDGYAEYFAKSAAGMRQTGAFGDPEQWHFDWEQSITRDQWLDRVPTFSGHTQFAPSTMNELLECFGAAIDAMGGSFTMLYTTAVVTAQRTRSA